MARVSSTGYWCLHAQCDEEALYRVEAQWNVADFDHTYACDRHLEFFIRRFQLMRVDGQPPLYVESVMLDLSDEVYLEKRIDNPTPS